jgi:hypothetical protein
MFTQSKIAAVVLMVSLAFASTTTDAAEVTLEQLVASLMSQAISATQQELQYSAQKAVLSASNSFSMDEEQETFIARVTITDLVNEEDKKQAE